MSMSDIRQSILKNYFDDYEEPEDYDSEPPKPVDDFYIIGKCLGRYNGPGGNVTVPEGITEIEYGTFQSRDSVTGITIPKSVIKISPGTLQDCMNLSEIRVDAENPCYCVIDGLLLERDGTVLHSCPPTTSGVLKIPKSVTEIGEKAFAFCRGLTDIIIPESVTRIGDEAFASCSGLTNIVIPESVTRIGDQTFAGCSGLTSVAIPKYTTHIGSFAFWGTNLTRIVIPENVAEIADEAFNGCTTLSEIQVDAGNSFYCIINGLLLNRDGSVLYQCPPATSGVLTIPEGVVKIADGAFAACKGLTGVIIPEGVTRIGEYAFANCTGLTHVNIPEGVTWISEDAFAGCTSLISVTVPKSVVYIGGGAFENTGLAEETIRAAYDQAEETDLESMTWNDFPDWEPLAESMMQNDFPDNEDEDYS